MNINHTLQELTLQEAWIALKDNAQHPSIYSNRTLLLAASLALIIFAAFASCWAVYLFRTRKQKTTERTYSLHDTNNDTKKLNSSTASSKIQGIGVEAGESTDQNEKENHLLNQVPLDPPHSSLSEIKEEDENIGKKLDDRQTSSWLNDHPDVSLIDLGLTTYDAMIHFLSHEGKQLRILNLGNFNCSDEEFEELVKLCPQIQQLFVSSNEISNKALKHIQKMPLTSVDFSGCRGIHEEGLEYLKGMPLTSVNFSGCLGFEDKGFERLKGMPLASVNFSGCYRIKGEGFKHLKGLPLTSIDFSGCYQLTEEAFMDLEGMQLTNINFEGSYCIKNVYLKYLKGMPLTSVNFSHCWQLTDEALKHLQGLRLTSVNFSGCKNLTDKALDYLKGMQLMHVDFSECDRLTSKALEFLKTF